MSDSSVLSVKSKGFLVYLVATAILCGALVMVIEVLGSRVIGPFFGVSLFVWTSLIAVTLISLALGYGVGGIVADRYSSADYLYGFILIAGLLVLVIPWIAAPVIKLSLPLGLRLGALVSTLVLFGPTLFLMGFVSPYLIKIAAYELHSLGRMVGSFYALSTFGSVIGTVLTGFLLIAYIGVGRIFDITGSLLIALSVGYFVFFQKHWLFAAALLIPLYTLWNSGQEAVISKISENGTRINLVAQRESFYGNVKVLDYEYGNNRTREMIIDGLVQGGINRNTGLSIYPYTYYLQFIPHALYPEGKTCLVIGLGAGLIPRWYQQQGISAHVVDIDPAVVELAATFFDYDASDDVVIQDARYFLHSEDSLYDYLILDVFNGDTTPGYLLSHEAVLLLSDRMSPDAVLGINLVGSLKRESLMTASVVKTLQQVFDQVEIYPTFVLDQTEGIGNLAIIAYHGEPRSIDWQGMRQNSIDTYAFNDVWSTIGARFSFPQDTQAIVLTDDYNPIDFYDAWLRESVRREILQSTDWEMLIGKKYAR
ncbi:MAG: fused MFS/spermidine synthase [Gammaproteobacteria bacterium]|nr:fused MFS/spermidine synthase [Gammaproteobacteria bacterium]